jgi:hypothetical protein
MARADCVTNLIRAPITGAGAKPSTKPDRMAYFNFTADLAAHSPRSIPLNSHAVDLKARADHPKVFTTVSNYMTAPGPSPSDLASDLTGALQNAVEAMAGRVA